jgi:2,3-bisphosphoglycerate-independent phosphoglycerate mutase
MKYVAIVLEGAATLNAAGKTPLENASTPEMKRLARRGRIGAVRLLPEEIRLPVEANLLSILGFDPRLYTGRGPVLAAALRVTVGEGDVAFCSPLIATDGDIVLSGAISALSDAETLELMNIVAERLSTRRLRFYPAPQNNSLLLFADGSTAISTQTPLRISEQPIKKCLPQGDESERLHRLIFDSLELLDNHPVNRRRRDLGLLPANTIWPYGQGIGLKLSAFSRRFGIMGTLVTTNLLLQGVARAAGLSVLSPPNEGHASRLAATRSALKEGADFILLPIVVGRAADVDDVRQEAIERVDREVITPLLNQLQKGTESFRLLCIATATASDPVNLPFLLYDAGLERQNHLPFDERAVSETGLIYEEGQRLLGTLLQ